MIPDNKRFNLGYIAHRTAVADPQRTAIVDLQDSGERVISYGELDRRLDRFAAMLSRFGLPLGERVALLVGNRYEYIEAMYGAMRAGLVPALINTKLGLDGLRASIEEVGARVAIVDPACNAAALEAAADVPHRIILDGVASGWQSYEDLFDAAPTYFDAPSVSSTQIAELCFTSGSTGRPKAVMISHRATLLKLHVYATEHKAMRDAPLCSLIHLPIFHANARLTAGVAFETGGKVIIQKKFNPRAILQNIAHYGVNYFFTVATTFTALLQEGDLLKDLDFSRMKFAIVGSAPSSRDVLEAIESRMGIRMLHTYGSTEAGTLLQHRLEDDAPLSSCGRALAGNEIRLVNAAGESCDYGELWASNEWLANGYWNRPEETDEKFVGGWYRSGDIFERDEKGDFYFRGRTDDMFNVAGEKVYPVEVERLLQMHPAVLEASVVPVAHQSKGEVPVAMVVLAQGMQASEQELKEHCLAKGPAYAHPRRILFTDAFPLAGTGKVDRKRIAAAFAGNDAQ